MICAPGATCPDEESYRSLIYASLQSRVTLVCVELTVDVVEASVELTVSADCVELAFVGDVDELVSSAFAPVLLDTSRTGVSEVDVEVVDTISSKLDVTSLSVEDAFML